jgi:hypothetical protein
MADLAKPATTNPSRVADREASDDLNATLVSTMSKRLSLTEFEQDDDKPLTANMSVRAASMLMQQRHVGQKVGVF